MRKVARRTFLRSLQVKEKTYKIPFPETLHEGTNLASGNITWNPDVTTVRYARLRVSGDLVVGGATPVTPVSGTAEFLVNGNWVGGVRVPESGACIGECHTGFTREYDMSPYLINGENWVTVELRKSWGWPTWIELRNFAAFIVIGYEGAEPGIEVKPPPPEWWPYVKWGLVGAGVIAVGAVLIRTVPELMKKK